MAAQKPSPFFVGEHLSLDFLNTVAAPWGREIEWIENGEELVSWLAMARAIPADVAEHFLASTASRHLDATAHEARELREWLRSFVTLHAGTALSREALADLAPVNAILGRDHAYRQIGARTSFENAPKAGAFRWDRKRHWGTPDTLLLPIADAIGDLVCDKDFTFVRQCEAPTCTLWFHDVSKHHARRWCSMAVCGNRAKAAAHRKRMRQKVPAKSGLIQSPRRARHNQDSPQR